MLGVLPRGARSARTPRLLASLLLATGSARSQSWTPSSADLTQLDHREVLLLAATQQTAAAGYFRAAIEIAAPAERVWRTMTDCAQALQFVPHLTKCRVLATAADGTWQIIEQEVDYAWYLPRLTYVFRADYEPDRSVRFSNVRGDFSRNDGVWELAPRGAAATVVTYRAQLVARIMVPGWLIRASLKRDLPALMEGLRARCEALDGDREPRAFD